MWLPEGLAAIRVVTLSSTYEEWLPDAESQSAFSKCEMLWLLVALVAEWIHFTLLGIILPTIKLKVYTFGGL